jgi:hypothetical protein
LKYFFFGKNNKEATMSSMGFTRDSIGKLMEMLDEHSSNSSIDEKTYLELANAAKYLYEEAGPRTRPETPPPPPEWGEVGSVLIPQESYTTPPRPNRGTALRRPVARVLEGELAAVRTQTSIPISIPRLNLDHKERALKKKLAEMGIEQGRSGTTFYTRTAYVKYLVEKCKYYGVTDREIKLMYKEEQRACMITGTQTREGIGTRRPTPNVEMMEELAELFPRPNRNIPTGIWSPNGDEDLMVVAARMAEQSLT